MHSTALRLSAITLVLIFLVILAGSIVRTTGAGMGCPDWPKCFGYLIPPTDPEPLTYREGKVFDRGQMVVLNDTLWVASEAHTASDRFDRTLWHKYERHDYAVFNAAHTWTEYINRLVGALSGLAAVALLIVTIRLRRTHPRAWWFAAGALFMIMVAAWLGKVVVDRNLHEGTITLHMLCSMAILTFLMLTRCRLKPVPYQADARFTVMAKIAWIVLTLQILLGTQVREHVDVLLTEGTRQTAAEKLLSDNWFIIHRSLSLLFFALVALMYRYNGRKLQPLSFTLLALLLFAEIAAGMILAYFSLPHFSQPLHLVLAMGMFTATCMLVVVTSYKKYQ
jgi:cytochrome c oxidase assembly protein subunit 15